MTDTVQGFEDLGHHILRVDHEAQVVGALMKVEPHAGCGLDRQRHRAAA